MSKRKPERDAGSPPYEVASPFRETAVLTPASWSMAEDALQRLFSRPTALEQPDDFRSYPNCISSSALPDIDR